jgi:hypothetical protein
LGTVIAGKRACGRVSRGIAALAAGGFSAARAAAITTLLYGSASAKIPMIANQKRCLRVPRLLRPKGPRPRRGRAVPPPAPAYAGAARPDSPQLDTAPHALTERYERPLRYCVD